MNFLVDVMAMTDFGERDGIVVFVRLEVSVLSKTSDPRMASPPGNR